MQFECRTAETGSGGAMKDHSVSPHDRPGGKHAAPRCLFKDGRIESNQTFRQSALFQTHLI